MRTYVSFELEQIRTMLDMFVEITLSRDLTTSEKYVHQMLLQALDRCLHGM